MSEGKKDKSDLLQKYNSLASELENIIRDFSKADLDFKPDNKWSVRQIVHHIVDSDAIVKTLIFAAIGNPGCTYDQSWYEIDNKWVSTMAYDQREVSSAVSLFRANIIHLEKLLLQIPEALDYFVIFKWPKNPEGIKLSVEYLVLSRIQHAKHHISRIREIHKLLLKMENK